MKRKYFGIMIFAFLVLFCLGIYSCFSKGTQIGNENAQTVSIQNRIITDSFADNTKIEQTIKEEIEIEVDEVGQDIVTVTVKAPDISKDLIDWVANWDGNIADEQMEEKILSLIQQSQKSADTYELYYEDAEGLNIQYTEEYLNAVSCGLNEFYNYAMNQVILEMLEENANE